MEKMNHIKMQRSRNECSGKSLHISRMLKRMLSLVLAMVLVLSLASGNGLVLSACAQEAGAEETVPSEIVPAETAPPETVSVEAVSPETAPSESVQESGEVSAQDDAVAAVQKLIDALPEAGSITEENAEAVKAQMTAIDEARAGLSDVQTDTLQTDKYVSTAAKLEKLAGQEGADEAELLSGESKVTSEQLGTSYSPQYYIYANGTPLILQKGTGGSNYTVIYEDVDGDGQVTDADRIYAPDGLDSTAKGNNYSAYCYIIGGSDADNISGDTSVTMEGGRVTMIYGGCWSGTVTGNTNVTIKGGTVSSVYGAGKSETSLVTGNTKVSMTGGKIENSIYGGGYDGRVDGSTEVSVTGGTVTNDVCGGSSGADNGSTGDITGSASVTIGGNANVYAIAGGSYYSGTVGKNTEVHINGGTITGYVCGSGYKGTVTGDASIIMDGGTVKGKVYGTSQSPAANVGGNVSVSITGGSVETFVLAKGEAGAGGEVSLTAGGTAKIGTAGATGFN